MATESSATITCEACGRRHPRDESKIGVPFKCACGVVLFINRYAPQDPGRDEYELADEEPEFEVVDDQTPVTPAPQSLGMVSVSSDVIRGRLGAVPPPKKHNQAEATAASYREFEKAMTPSVMRDFVIPGALIALGVWMLYYQMLHVGRDHSTSFAAATPYVLGRVILNFVLLEMTILLSIVTFEVSLIGRFVDNILKLAAVAIFPIAIDGLCVYSMGDMNGAMIGTLLTIAAYAVLFKFLVKLDLKDTCVCAMIVFILVTAVNYGIYKVQGNVEGNWLEMITPLLM